MQQEIWFQKYQILGLLGSGGTARVYLARHVKLNSYRAIKCISKNNPLYELQRKEAIILKSLRHSCIPIIYDIEEDEEGSYIIEQYLEGSTLKECIRTKGPLPENILIEYAVQLCGLIHYLHSSDPPLLYVDLKPDNILIHNSQLKLIDFGSAVYRDEHSAGSLTAATKGFAAPELYHRGRIDERCDIYGMGMLLYYMASGAAISPEAGSISNIDQSADCSEQLKRIINRCLRYRPALRYSSVEQLKKQLSILGGNSHGNRKPDHGITVAIAGSQPRIGVTHLAFRLCLYMKSRGICCLYRESNESGCLQSLKDDAAMQKEREEVLRFKGISVLDRKPETMGGTPAGDSIDTGVLVVDYGRLSRDNREKFLEADIKLLVLGAKEWELAYSEEVLDGIAEYKEIFYLFNFLSGKQFQWAAANMGRQRCCRIPYEPDPFARTALHNGQELFDELLGLRNGCRGRRKKTAFLHRGRREERSDLRRRCRGRNGDYYENQGDIIQ
ncbi:serine/threonine-protein kinase [Anaerotaenia torta]|uniref:serine/threonine protein kinase n=1 Tax=Anaerotaenia torta TaxID=433293 RepID=UPI003D1F84CF